MRRQLMPFLGARYRFAATVVKFGLRHEISRGALPTMLLHDAALDTGSVIVVAQHLWTDITNEVVQLNPRRGDRICFDAIVQEYYKFNDSGRELLDYTIGKLANIDLASGGKGLSLVEYLNNLKRSKTYANGQIEVTYTA